MIEENILDYKIKKRPIREIDIQYLLSLLLIAYPVFYPAFEICGHFGQYGLFFLWFIISILKKKYFLTIVIKDTFIYIGFFLIIVIRVLDAIPFITFNDFYSPIRLLPQFSLILIYYIFGLYHNKYSDDRTKKDLIYVFLISFIISALISLYHLSHNQYAIRYAIGFAIGDFNLVYTGVCIVSIIVYLMLNKRLNMQLMIILIISVLLVLKANYMTAIALMSVLILLSILLKIRKKLCVIYDNIYCFNILVIIKT